MLERLILISKQVQSRIQTWNLHDRQESRITASRLGTPRSSSIRILALRTSNGNGVSVLCAKSPHAMGHCHTSLSFGVGLVLLGYMDRVDDGGHTSPCRLAKEDPRKTRAHMMQTYLSIETRQKTKAIESRRGRSLD